MLHTDPPFGARVPSRRDAVLAALRAAEGARSAEELATTVDLHVNTARFHLRRLVEDGQAEQSTQSRGTPGRPRVLYRARVADSGTRSYLLLAQMMAETAAASGDLTAAESTGRAWGARLLADADAADDVAGHLHGVLDSIGFEPEIVVEDDGLEITLHHCPFVEVARRHPTLVCGMHGALIQGVLDGLDSGVRVRELLPFVEPSRCVARLRSA